MPPAYYLAEQHFPSKKNNNQFQNKDEAYFPVVGKTGFNYKFDFSIPKSRTAPERIVQTISTANRDNATNLVFKWMDTKERRPAGSTLIAMLNDSDRIVSSAVDEAFKNYGIKLIRWSQRKDSLSYLAS